MVRVVFHSLVFHKFSTVGPRLVLNPFSGFLDGGLMPPGGAKQKRDAIRRLHPHQVETISRLHLFKYGSGNGLRQFTPSAVGGLLVVLEFLQPLEKTFLVTLFLETPESLLKGLIAFYADFGHAVQPPFCGDISGIPESYHYSICLSFPSTPVSAAVLTHTFFCVCQDGGLKHTRPSGTSPQYRCSRGGMSALVY